MARADEILQAGAPPFDALQATLIAAEALTGGRTAARSRAAAGRRRRQRSTRRWRPRRGANTCGCAASAARKGGSAADAYHDFAQSATLLDLLGERYQAGLSHLALGRLVAQPAHGRSPSAILNKALAVFEQLGAERDLDDTRAAQRC